MCAQTRVVGLVDELRRVYEEKRPYANGRRIRGLYDLIEKHCQTYDDYMYLITHLAIADNGTSRRRIAIRTVIPMCDTLQRICEIYPFVPPTWDDKKALLEKAIDFAQNKEEVVSLLKQFKIL